MSVIIRLQNLPWSASSYDIRQYFQGLSIPEGGVHIVGGELGDAFIAFSTDEDARQAMMRTGGKLKEIQVSLLLSSRSEMQKVIESTRSSSFPPLQPAIPPPVIEVIPQQPVQLPPVIPPQLSLKPDKESGDDEARDSRKRSRSRSRDRHRGSSRKDSSRRRRSRSRSRSRDRRRSSRRSRSRSRNRDRYGRDISKKDPTSKELNKEKDEKIDGRARNTKETADLGDAGKTGGLGFSGDPFGLRGPPKVPFLSDPLTAAMRSTLSSINIPVPKLDDKGGIPGLGGLGAKGDPTPPRGRLAGDDRNGRDISPGHGGGGFPDPGPAFGPAPLARGDLGPPFGSGSPFSGGLSNRNDPNPAFAALNPSAALAALSNLSDPGAALAALLRGDIRDLKLPFTSQGPPFMPSNQPNKNMRSDPSQVWLNPQNDRNSSVLDMLNHPNLPLGLGGFNPNLSGGEDRNRGPGRNDMDGNESLDDDFRSRFMGKGLGGNEERNLGGPFGFPPGNNPMQGSMGNDFNDRERPGLRGDVGFNDRPVIMSDPAFRLRDPDNNDRLDPRDLGFNDPRGDRGFNGRSGPRGPEFIDRPGLRSPDFNDRFGPRGPEFNDRPGPRGPEFNDRSGPRGPDFNGLGGPEFNDRPGPRGPEFNGPRGLGFNERPGPRGEPGFNERDPSRFERDQRPFDGPVMGGRPGFGGPDFKPSRHNNDSNRGPHFRHSGRDERDDRGRGRDRDRGKDARNDSPDRSPLPGKESYCVELRNCPVVAYKDVRRAFAHLGCNIDDIVFHVSDGTRRVGVKFPNWHNKMKALQETDRLIINGVHTTIAHLPDEEFDAFKERSQRFHDNDNGGGRMHGRRPDFNEDRRNSRHDNDHRDRPGRPGGRDFDDSRGRGRDVNDSRPGGRNFDDSHPGGRNFDDSHPGGRNFDDNLPDGRDNERDRPNETRGSGEGDDRSRPAGNGPDANRPMQEPPLTSGLNEADNRDCVLVANLPSGTTDRDICDFFSDIGLTPKKLHMMLTENGEPSGETYVEFWVHEQAKRACSKDGAPLGRFNVSVKLVERGQMLDAIGLGEEDDMAGPMKMPPFPLLGPGFPPRMLGPGPMPLFPGRLPMVGPGPMPFGGPEPPAGGGTPPSPDRVVTLDNVPYRAGTDEILAFFGPSYKLTPDDVFRKMNDRGQPTSEARVVMASSEDAARAVNTLCNSSIHSRTIKLRILKHVLALIHG